MGSDSPLADSVAPDATSGADLLPGTHSEPTSPPSPDPSQPAVHRSKTAPLPQEDISSEEDSSEGSEQADTSAVSEPESVEIPTGILSPPGLRRSRSSVDATNGRRVTKHLRFTAPGDSATSSIRVNTAEHVIYPGGGRRRKRNVPRDQEWLLSGPPTPNISET